MSRTFPHRCQNLFIDHFHQAPWNFVSWLNVHVFHHTTRSIEEIDLLPGLAVLPSSPNVSRYNVDRLLFWSSNRLLGRRNTSLVTYNCMPTTV
jgi:hypothetical protein